MPSSVKKVYYKQEDSDNSEKKRKVSLTCEEKRIFEESIPKRRWFLHYFCGLLASLGSLWLFRRMHHMHFEDLPCTCLLVTVSSAYLLSMGYRVRVRFLRPLLAEHYQPKKEKQLTKKKVMDLDLLVSSYSVFFSNSVFFSVILFTSFFLFKKYMPLWNYILSVGLGAVLSIFIP